MTSAADVLTGVACLVQQMSDNTSAGQSIVDAQLAAIDLKLLKFEQQLLGMQREFSGRLNALEQAVYSLLEQQKQSMLVVGAQQSD
jgi:hypothetical protein